MDITVEKKLEEEIPRPFSDNVVILLNSSVWTILKYNDEIHNILRVKIYQDCCSLSRRHRLYLILIINMKKSGTERLKGH